MDNEVISRQAIEAAIEIVADLRASFRPTTTAAEDITWISKIIDKYWKKENRNE